MATDSRIPVLAYHSLHAPGTDYATNDHVALEEDLRIIRRLGVRVVSALRVARAVAAGSLAALGGRCVALTFDDGPHTDFVDVDDSRVGLIKSFRRILLEQFGPRGRIDRWVRPGAAYATSFVIASPEARTQLDRAIIAGRGEWADGWWQEAVSSGLFHIGNHSWDHLHPLLDAVAHSEQARGDFGRVTSEADADRQILEAWRYIFARAPNPGAGLFAYPYGHVSEYLAGEYFPQRAGAQGFAFAAFTTAGEFVLRNTNRWRIPRFVCGEHWKDPAGLESILRRASNAP